jgi:hypothetical protein
MALRDSQITIEVLQTEANPNLRDSQITIEVLQTEANPTVRNSQIAILVLERSGSLISPALMVIA